jgi:hypothetical protein
MHGTMLGSMNRAGLLRVVRCQEMVPVRNMGVVPGFFVFAGLVVFCSDRMMFGCVRVVLGRVTVMFCTLM